jgi:hypothetical protein
MIGTIELLENDKVELQEAGLFKFGTWSMSMGLLTMDIQSEHYSADL